MTIHILCKKCCCKSPNHRQLQRPYKKENRGKNTKKAKTGKSWIRRAWVEPISPSEHRPQGPRRCAHLRSYRSTHNEKKGTRLSPCPLLWLLCWMRVAAFFPSPIEYRRWHNRYPFSWCISIIARGDDKKCPSQIFFQAGRGRHGWNQSHFSLISPMSPWACLLGPAHLLTVPPITNYPKQVTPSPQGRAIP